MEEFKDPEEKEAARHILEAYLEDVGQYCNVPSEHATGYCYRIYLSRPDGSDIAAAEYEFYYRTVNRFGQFRERKWRFCLVVQILLEKESLGW